MFDPILSGLMEPSQRPVLIGILILVGWSLAEWSLNLFRMYQPRVKTKEHFSYYLVVFSFKLVFVFSTLDAIVFHLTTVGDQISHIQYTGIPICFGSMAGFLFMILFGIPALFYRMRIEEEALLQRFGKEYEEYQQKTFKIIPLLW